MTIQKKIYAIAVAGAFLASQANADSTTIFHNKQDVLNTVHTVACSIDGVSATNPGYIAIILNDLSTKKTKNGMALSAKGAVFGIGFDPDQCGDGCDGQGVDFEITAANNFDNLLYISQAWNDVPNIRCDE